MKIVSCFKNIRDEHEIQVTSSRKLDFSAASWMLGPYDLNAVEAAMRISADNGAEVCALTAAGDVIDNAKQRKTILARGPQELYAVKDASLENADSYAVSKVLAEAIKKMGDVDLVLFGEGSGDMYAQQTGVMTGALLGWPTVNAVFAINIEGDEAVVERSTDKGLEVLRVKLPAAITVTSDINIPRIPSMKDILGAGKKPVTVWSLDEVAQAPAASSETVSILAPEEVGREKIVYEKLDDEACAAVAAQIRKML